jgi:hypothetical protein
MAEFTNRPFLLKPKNVSPPAGWVVAELRCSHLLQNTLTVLEGVLGISLSL